MEGKRILITGGAGFIGTHVAQRLFADNEVTLLDVDLENALPYSCLAQDDKVRKVQGDVRDWELVEKEVADSDLVLHFASVIGVRKVIDHARETIDTIAIGTRNVLEAARKNCQLERLVYISTSEVYGNILNATEGEAASVGTNNDPRLSYAAAKLLGEHMVWAYHRDFGLPTVIIRPFNIYGPMRKASHAIAIFVVKALANQDITLYGDGSQLRSWCYIDDFCDGVIACLDRAKAEGEDFNLGNPKTAATIYDLAQRTIRLIGSQSKIRLLPADFSEIGVRALNSMKAEKILGYRPQFDMDQGLVPTIEWYRENLDDFQEWL
jgi:UDP-glucose 4-epimerase